jgi:hypothetical protein
MKITRSQLKQLILEELDTHTLSEVSAVVPVDLQAKLDNLEKEVEKIMWALVDDSGNLGSILPDGTYSVRDFVPEDPV